MAARVGGNGDADTSGAKETTFADTAKTMAHGQCTEIEARGALEAWKRSGQSIEKFAWSRGLVPQRLWGSSAVTCGRIAAAIRYAAKQWTELGVYQGRARAA